MSIVNNDSNMLVSGTSGNDNITNYGSNVTINAESGNDSINNEEGGTNVTINGGYGNDKVWNKDSYVMINGNFGDDLVYSGWFTPKSYFSSGASYYPECCTLDGGTGNDTLQSRGDYTFVIGGEGDDTINSGGRYEGYNTIFAGNGNDSILSSASHSIIYGEDGNDLLHNEGGKYCTIVGGKGDDTIKLWADGEKGSVIEYTEGDGNDVVMFSGQHFRVPDLNFSILKGSYTVERFGDRFGDGLLIKVGNGSIRVYRVTVAININGTPVTTETATFSTTTTDTQTTTSTTQTTTPTSTTPTTTDITTTSTPATSMSTNTQTTTPTSTTTPTTSTTTDGNGGGTTIIYNGPVTIINNTTINETNITNINNTYTYNGGDKIINNYQVGQVVQLASDYQGIDVKGNSFLVKSSSGAVEIQNARDKFIGYSGSDNNVVAYSYLASGDGQIDGRGKNQAEIMIGGDNANNQIYAGSGGSSLWGGNGGADTLTGGAGYDEFFYAVGSGNDIIQNAGDDDVVNLLGVSLEQISYAEVNYSDINIGFTDGGKLQLQGQSATGFKLEGVTYTANRSTGEWSTK